MKNKLAMLAISLMAFASPMLAQGTADTSGNAVGAAYRYAAAYIALGVAAGLCGLGQGKATASAVEAMARNPGSIAAIRVALLIGLAFIESLTLYLVVITFIAKP